VAWGHRTPRCVLYVHGFAGKHELEVAHEIRRLPKSHARTSACAAWITIICLLPSEDKSKTATQGTIRGMPSQSLQAQRAVGFGGYLGCQLMLSVLFGYTACNQRITLRLAMSCGTVPRITAVIQYAYHRSRVGQCL